MGRSMHNEKKGEVDQYEHPTTPGEILIQRISLISAIQKFQLL